MTRFIVSLVLIGVVGAGCAHEDAPKPTTPTKPASAPVAAAKPPVAAPAPAATAQLPSQVASARDDDAIYFDFDSSLVRDDARPVLQKVGAQVKTKHESLKVEGNCDEVGTVEYNLALGEARARAAKEYLVHLGVPSSRIAIASFGSQRPKDPGHDEAAHAKNRRDDLVVR
jgi:peptidoglycan-associated lipoprotein